jgi:hypothetical protein
MFQLFIERIAALKLNKVLAGNRSKLLGYALIAQGIAAILQSEDQTQAGLTSIVTGLGIIFARVGSRNDQAELRAELKNDAAQK